MRGWKRHVAYLWWKLDIDSDVVFLRLESSFGCDSLSCWSCLTVTLKTQREKVRSGGGLKCLSENELTILLFADIKTKVMLLRFIRTDVVSFTQYISKSVDYSKAGAMF